jgi:hypothetical protein
MSRQTLDRVLAVSKEEGITITLPDDRECLLEGVIVDSGANLLLVTELLCKELGLHVDKSGPLPGLRAIDGKTDSYLVGKTAPFTLTLGKGSSHPAVIPVPSGAYVIKGDANNMYKMVLDKQTLLPVFGHVNPAYQRLVWYPNAATGDTSVINGIPVSSEVAEALLVQLPTDGVVPAVELLAVTALLDDGESPATCQAHSSTGSSTPPAAAQEATHSTPAANTLQEITGVEEGTTATGSTPRGFGSYILPACSQLLMWTVLLLLGVFHYTVDMPLFGLPSFFWSWLLRTAAGVRPSGITPPLSTGSSQAGRRAGHTGALQHAAQLHYRKARKRRYSKHKLMATPATRGWLSAIGRVSAKTTLFVLLCLLVSCTTTAAMQVSRGMAEEVAGRALQEQRRLEPSDGTRMPIGTHAQHLLQHRLSQLPTRHFAATADADEEREVKWYQPGPSVLNQLSPDGAADDPHDARWTVHPEGQWILGNHPEATPEQMARLVAMLENNKGAFAYKLSDVTGYTGGEVGFKLIDPNKRMWSPQRRYTDEEYEFGDEKMKEMWDAGIVIELPTTNPHASCVTLPMKRAADGSWTDKRWCVDTRVVNANTVVDKYGMPLPEELFRRIRGAKFLVKADFKSGFWQLKIDEESQKHVAFWWRNKLYTYTRLPFGHVNATALFQRVMEKELQAAGLTHCAAPFVDDVILWANSFDEMYDNLQTMLRHLQGVGLRLHPAKTIVCADCLPYLGHLVSATHCKPEPAKIAGIRALPVPTNLKQLQAQVGLFNYYRCYVPTFSQKAQPLYCLMQKGAAYVWSEEAHQSYNSLKDALCTPGLALRQPDDHLPFHLYVDWSNQGIAAVLNQKETDGREYMVACASRSLNAAEKNYAASKGEMLAAVWGVKMFRPYLHSREFFLHTDHRALLWLLTHKAPVGQQMRWVLALQEYRFTLVHKQGSTNPADVPSREASSCVADCTGARLDTDPVDWPLPAVLRSDFTPDPVTYTHDGLARDLGLAARTSMTNTTGSGDTAALATPAACLALAPAPPTPERLRYDSLEAALASNDAVLDAYLPTSASLLGGESPGSSLATPQQTSSTQQSPGGSRTCNRQQQPGWRPPLSSTSAQQQPYLEATQACPTSLE